MCKGTETTERMRSWKESEKERGRGGVRLRQRKKRNGGG